MSSDDNHAPGWPGIEPRWTSSAKSGVGTSLKPESRVWFTTSHGILDEIYYPRVDQACTRDLGFIVTDRADFFSEEKRDTDHEVSYIAPGCPGYKLTNTCESGQYRIEKEVLADPIYDVVLQRVTFTPLKGSRDDYHLYVLLAPHLGNRGAGNTAWVDDYKGVPMLFAERDGYALALACSAPWRKRSAGFVGSSDGWQDLHSHKQMTWTYGRAENGNVALTGEVDLASAGESFELALGFGLNSAEAGYRALASLNNGYDTARSAYIEDWNQWQQRLLDLDPEESDKPNIYRVSTAVLRTHQAKRFPGGLIASLSIPWGFSKGDDDLGGYHLVWPRDLAEIGGGLLAAGAGEEAGTILDYLQTTQDADGHWPQNMWLNGTPYWGGVQMDETAFPILLLDLAHREKALKRDLDHYWPMVRRAAGYLVRNGPVTQQDRWEEDPGYSPFTLAVEVAALLTAADLAELQGDQSVADYLRETADTWNDNIEAWTYSTGTDLAKEAGVDGYYVRIAPPEETEASSPTGGFVPIKNRPPGQSSEPATEIVSPDALALVRFGLRAADAPEIVNTVKVIDEKLKVETPTGPAWHRYNDDGYGEHDDGSPFDGTGTGRAWPLLTGERAHYELAAGRSDEAGRLLGVLESFSGSGGLLPEQVWDSPDLPERALFFGRPSGSAMPLAWAHAEYVKLRRSLKDGHVFDTPPQPVQRYQIDDVHSRYVLWRGNNKLRSMAKGKTLRVEVLQSTEVHWSTDDWGTIQKTHTQDSGLGINFVDLPTDKLSAGDVVAFSFFEPSTGKQRGEAHTVKVVDSDQ